MTPRTRLVIAVAFAGVLLGSLATFAALSGLRPSIPGPRVQDFLIVASVDGFNGSALSPYSTNGVQQTPWPVIHVQKGTTVNITVYNEDRQAHGFQVAHYFDGAIETVAPGQRLNVSFVANTTGTFRIYCSIPCSVHWAMQDGELVVG